MSNNKSGEKDYWEELSKKIKNPVEVKNKRPDTSDIEIPFLKKYVKPQDEVLDLGSGSGLIINKLLPFVKSITAVEKYEGFSKFITEASNMTVINADLRGFKIRKEYDVILLFGVAQSFCLEDATEIYENIYDMLKEGGTFISRIHCGLEEEINVNGFSEELGMDYFAQYRIVDSEIELLKKIGFQSIEKFDIFPDTLNVWDNSRHFIFVCKK